MKKELDFEFLPTAQAAKKRRLQEEEDARNEKERDELQRMLLMILAVEIAFILGTMWNG